MWATFAPGAWTGAVLVENAGCECSQRLISPARASTEMTRFAKWPGRSVRPRRTLERSRRGGGMLVRELGTGARSQLAIVCGKRA